MDGIKRKVGAVINVIGRTGMGKSPTIKNLARVSGMKNKIVYDRRREYPDDWTKFYSMQMFKKAWVNFTDSFIVIEEATGFIAAFKDMELTDILIGNQHNRNTIVFVFHSISDMPPYIKRLSDFIYLFMTNDSEADIKSNRKEFYEYWKNTGAKDPNTGYYLPELIDVNEI